MSRPWYQEFFSGLTLDFWRDAVPRERTVAEADFIETALELAPDARVLDLACGFGRLSLELARRGYQPLGLDVAARCVDETRAAAAEENLRVESQVLDVLELDARSEFDGAVCFGNSFAYFDAKEMTRFLAGVSRALKPGARLAAQTGMVTEALLPNFQERWSMRSGGTMLLMRNEYSERDSRLSSDCVFTRDGRREARRCYHWVYPAERLGELLTEAGLELEASYGSLDGRPFQKGDLEMILLARRA